jgi:hypothetical protein
VNIGPAGAPGAIPPPDQSKSTGARRLRRAVGFMIGVALLAAAGWVLYSQRRDMGGAWQSMRAAPLPLIAAAALLPLVNWLLISLSFWILMRRYGRIGPGEMTAAIGGAWLLNYLPLRAGMIGRVAYHKAVNRIPVRDSVRVMILGMALGMAAVLTVLGIAAALAGRVSGPEWGIALGLPPLIALLATGICAKVGAAWWYPAVYVIRYLDVLAWAARYAVVFAIVGAPIGLPGAVATAAACQVALVIPLVGNGLGLREWAIALTAAALAPAMLASSTDLNATTGLLADVVNRAAEVAVAVPVGIISLMILTRRLHAAQAAGTAEPAVAR